MPNHCSNDLIISGPKADIERFIEAARDSSGDIDKWTDQPYHIRLNNFVPCPPEYLEDGGAFPRWYDWRITNWGTKWDCYSFHEPEWSPKGRTWKVTFDTAWTPPEQAFIEIAKQFPTLTFNLRYYEGGMCFKGQLKVKGEEIKERWQGEYRGHRGG